MKARFKTIVLSALSSVAIFSAVVIASCNEDKCKAIACAYGGVCKEGTCICAAGYEGTQCETITREKYAGVWTVFEKGTYTETAQYDVSFVNSNSGSMTDMNVKNFYNRITGNVAVKLKNDTVYIPVQVVQNYKIQGWGLLDREAYYAKHGKIVMHYMIEDLSNGLVNDFGVNTGQASIWQR
jgi:uncharacterized membrane protein